MINPINLTIIVNSVFRQQASMVDFYHYHAMSDYYRISPMHKGAKNMNKKSRALLAGCVMTLKASTAAPLSARDAKCLIETPEETFHDTCDFKAGPKGSFSLTSSPSVGHFLSSASIVSVSIYGPGKADVRGLTRDGINSRWGEANRSVQDGACWRGADFRICAW